MRLLKKYLPQSEFGKNVFTLMSGTFVAQIIPLAIAPVLSRVYTAEDFGIYELFSRFIGIAAVLTTCRYDIAVMLPSKKNDAFNLVALAALISLLFSVILFCLVLIFTEFIFSYLKIPYSYSFLIYFVPLYIFFIGLNQTLISWNLRKKKFKTQISSKIFQNITLAIFTIILGYLNYGVVGLIIGAILGTIVSVYIYFRENRIEDQSILSEISKESIIAQAKKYINFPKVNLWHALIDTFQTTIQVFLISFYFNKEILGFYAFGLRIVQTPLGLIGKSISQVYFQQASIKYANGEEIYKMTINLIKSLFIYGVPLLLVVFFFCGELFSFVFGTQWREAGVYIQILSPWLYISFVGSIIANIPIIVNKQKQSFILSILSNTLFIAAIFYGGYIAKDIKLGLWLISLSQVIYFIIEIFWFLRIVKNIRINYE